MLKALFEQRAFALFGPTHIYIYISRAPRKTCAYLAPKERPTTRRERERERKTSKKKKKKKKKKKEESVIMAWTNFVITGAAIVAVASLMRSDVRTSTAMLRRNVKTLRQMMEEAVSNTTTNNNASNAASAADAAKRSAKEEATKKLKK